MDTASVVPYGLWTCLWRGLAWTSSDRSKPTETQLTISYFYSKSQIDVLKLWFAFCITPTKYSVILSASLLRKCRHWHGCFCPRVAILLSCRKLCTETTPGSHKARQSDRSWPLVQAESCGWSETPMAPWAMGYDFIRYDHWPSPNKKNRITTTIMVHDHHHHNHRLQLSYTMIDHSAPSGVLLQPEDQEEEPKVPQAAKVAHRLKVELRIASWH